MATVQLFLEEAFQVVSETTIQGAFFGINFSLYFLCTQLFYRQYRKAPFYERKRIVFSFLYTSLMIIAAAWELGADTRFVQLAYIDHGGTHGEPGEFIDKVQNTPAVILAVNLPGLIIGTLNPLMQLWRAWVIWSTSPYKLVVTVPPLLLVITSLTLDIYNIILPATTPRNLQLALAIVIVSLNVVFTVIVTLLLVGRIIFLRRRHNFLMGTTSSETANQYTSVVAILIESYALDAVWATITVITFALAINGEPISLYQVFNNTGDQVSVIAFLFVVYRVLLGRAWTPQTGRELSTMRWNHDLTEDTTTETASMDDTPRELGSPGVAKENVDLV